MPYVMGEDDDSAHQIAQYCLAEIFRAGATETGIVEDDEVIRLNIDEYREVLHAAAEQVVEHTTPELPWYVRQQALLFLATRDSPLPRGVDGDSNLKHYAALLRFLSDPSSASSATEFATFSVLARRCFVPSKAAVMLAPHINRSRLARIAETDPAFALELIDVDRNLLEHLPEHIGRDLCLTGAVPAGHTYLSHLVLKGEKPFRDELSLLQFAKKHLRFCTGGRRA